MADQTIRALIVEDHAVLSQALASALLDHGFETTVMPTTELDAPTVLATARDIKPAVVLLDLYLGTDLLGIPLIEPLRGEGSAVVVLTTSQDPVLLGECALAGAVAVVDKAEPFDRLVAVLTDAAAGQPMPEERLAELLDARHAVVEQRNVNDRRFNALTPREAEVLGLLMGGAAAKRIAYDLGISVSTVRSQIRAILEKLGVGNQRAAVIEATRAGWQPPSR